MNTEPNTQAGIDHVIEFARWAIRESAFAGCDLPGEEVQEKALALGLLREEMYNPEKHKAIAEEYDYDGEEGDPIMLFAGPLA